MGKLIDGKWHPQSVITSDHEGRYDRIPRSFREKISSEHPRFKPESGRYHLYVSYACPWAHRTLIMRELKELTQHISFNIVSPDMLDNGWIFDENHKEENYDKKFLYEIYQMADPKISTSVTVPVLWDKKEKTIVNNESSEIIRFFNTEFNSLTGNKEDFYPSELQVEINQFNERIYEPINNGVYKTGFAKNQKAYDDAVKELFTQLDYLENHLEGREYLVGDRFTEADIRLIPTLLRFDIVYYVHFKCNIRMIREYKNLNRYMKNLYNLEAIKKTTNFEHIKRHYYFSHDGINPYRIVPAGPREQI